MTPRPEHPDFDDAAAAAVEWAVLMRSGEVSTAHRSEFDNWMNCSETNRAAWQRLESALAPFARAVAHGKDAARGALDLTRVSRRRFVRNGIATVSTIGVAGVAGSMLWQRKPDEQIASTYQTGTAERREVVLTDRTHLFINARSKVGLRARATRAVLLQTGTLYADVARDNRDAPFSVETSDGWIRTSSAALEIATLDHETRVSVRRARAFVETAGGLQATLLPGDVIEFGRQSIKRISSSVPVKPDWINGLLVASDVPLSTVIDALRPYYRGYIRVTPAAARHRVTGVFSLDNANLAFEQIAETLAVNVMTYANYLVVVSAS